MYISKFITVQPQLILNNEIGPLSWTVRRHCLIRYMFHNYAVSITTDSVDFDSND